mmetsp:Transcript_101862/g.287384  ORF Transcript_101862/g.287384 Transcript_101862/m.287384 type:complete len:293 (-) Transcript_101862:850-1728(-)
MGREALRGLRRLVAVGRSRSARLHPRRSQGAVLGLGAQENAERAVRRACGLGAGRCGGAAEPLEKVQDEDEAHDLPALLQAAALPPDRRPGQGRLLPDGGRQGVGARGRDRGKGRAPTAEGFTGLDGYRHPGLRELPGARVLRRLPAAQSSGHFCDQQGGLLAREQTRQAPRSSQSLGAPHVETDQKRSRQRRGAGELAERLRLLAAGRAPAPLLGAPGPQKHLRRWPRQLWEVHLREPLPVVHRLQAPGHRALQADRWGRHALARAGHDLALRFLRAPQGFQACGHAGHSV